MTSGSNLLAEIDKLFDTFFYDDDECSPKGERLQSEVKKLIIADKERMIKELEAMSHTSASFPSEKFMTLEHVKSVISGA